MEDVLRYSPNKKNRSTVRRQYKKWRGERGMPDRCDNQDCQFHMGPLVWLGKPLPLILDHKSGNNLDDSPKNLRYLCPNCDAQQPTRGGANRGRVENAVEGAFVLIDRDGRRNHHVIPDPARIRITTFSPTVVITSSAKNLD
jgi:hypothetical protein